MLISKLVKFIIVGWVLLFGMVACAPAESQDLPSEQVEPPEHQASPGSSGDLIEDNLKSKRNYDDLEIVTLLPRDGIPAIDNPKFLSAGEADDEYAPEELVIGVNYDGDARAYSIPFLSSREIVNDTVGGKKIAVTW